jgi:signal-transduction protein with cAMP-binding, CBS, and nucleotidyltransferase domain
MREIGEVMARNPLWSKTLADFRRKAPRAFRRRVSVQARPK